MKYIIRLSPEITIKSTHVRKKAIKLLNKNIKSVLKYNEILDYTIKYSWDRIDLKLHDEKNKEKLEKIVWNTFGISNYFLVEEFDFINIDDIYKNIKDNFLNLIENSTFCVRVKRSWTHSFSSTDLEKQLWAYFLKDSKNTKVNLKTPLVKIEIQIKDNKVFLIKKSFRWRWWFPTWFQNKVLSLISWWFDSSVSSYMMMKRWVKMDFLFFNLWWDAHELWVKQVAYYLWSNFWIWYNSKFISIDLSKLIWEFMTKITPRYRWVLLKRYMLKIASNISHNYQYALVKWDSLWQVSSQTLENIHLINKASSTVVLRPLIWFDKEDIISIAKDIWTYNFSCSMPEYCWIISDNPATSAKEDSVLLEESKIDENIISEILSNIKLEKLKNILEFKKDIDDIEIVDKIQKDEVIIDLRESDKIQKNPLKIENTKVIEIPFYEINYKFEKLDQNTNYLFYCDKWVLSKLHWLYLKDKWFNNIKIYRQ